MDSVACVDVAGGDMALDRGDCGDVAAGYEDVVAVVISETGKDDENDVAATDIIFGLENVGAGVSAVIAANVVDWTADADLDEDRMGSKVADGSVEPAPEIVSLLDDSDVGDVGTETGSIVNVKALVEDGMVSDENVRSLTLKWS